MHGGRIEAYSEGTGRGSEFRVHLPRQQTPVQERAPLASVEERSGLKLRVLIVDDNQDAADTLALLMKLEGYTVAVANDGSTALAEESTFQPQLVLLDIGMPGMDGYEVARELRARAPGKSLVIVAVTGYGQPEDRARAKEAGFSDHLTKPINPLKLKATIKAHFREKV
jgi:DNA-binding response OmpR family regulator